MTNKLLDGLAALPDSDKSLVKWFVYMAVLSLGIGVVAGFLTAFARADFLQFEAITAFRILTLHGVTIFFYWLYFLQAGAVLILAAIYTGGDGRIAWAKWAWAGLAFMVAGFIFSELAPALGSALLYNAPPELVEGDSTLAGLFYLGYLLLGFGLGLVAISAVATALKSKSDGKVNTWSAVGFAAVAWAGLLMVSAVASTNAFLPAALWAFDMGGSPASYTMSWNILFHNVHYLPLMATVVIWYVMVEALAGVRSIFGQNFSKIVFASYLLFVPPTSLYHMFLEPNLAETVRVGGSLLSLFISVPTVLVFLVIVSSLEAHARANGAKGLFGWIKMLPWQNPAMTAIGMAVVNLAIGGVFAFVLIQESLAPLVSDTFFVPGYFHFLTVGTVTLTFLALLMYVIPGLTGHNLWRPRVLNVAPYITTFGLLIFGAAGIAAGYLGAPRRAFDIDYFGAAPGAWATLMTFVGIGATFMTIGLAIYVYGIARSLMGDVRTAGQGVGELSVVSWGGGTIGRQTAWVGPLAVLVLIVAMFGFTSLAFEIINDIPIIAVGGH